MTVLLPPEVGRGAGSAIRRLAGDTLRRLGVRHPHDLAVRLRSLGRGPYWRVPVLAYHRIEPPPGRPWEAGYFVAPEAFAEQMAALAAEGCETVRASELWEAVAGLRTLPD